MPEDRISEMMDMEDEQLEQEFEKQQEKNIWRFSNEDRKGWI